MGHIGDVHGLSIALMVPLVCFVLVGLYSFAWGKLSKSNVPREVKPQSH